MGNTRQELELSRQAMIRQMAETEKELQKYAKFPKDEYPDNTVLLFKRTIQITKNAGPRISASVRYVELMGDQLERESPTARQRRVGRRPYETNTDYQLRLAQEAHSRAQEMATGKQFALNADNVVVNVSSPDFPEPVIEDKEITYTALKAGDKWFLSGQDPDMRAGRAWDDLVELFLEWNVKSYKVLVTSDQTVDLG